MPGYMPGLTPEKPKSGLRKVADAAELATRRARGVVGSGLNYVGETLTKPSRAAWGTAEGLTSGDWSGGGPLNLVPFSDSMGWTDPSKGVEASGYLENRGVIPENTPGFDRWDIPRLGLDIVGDPTTWVTGLGLLKALGPGGKALKGAGLYDDLVKASGKGSREFLGSTTLGDVLPKLKPEQVVRLETSLGGKVGDDLLQKPLGGLLGFNKPFRDPTRTVTHEGLAKWLDDFGPVKALDKGVDKAWKAVGGGAGASGAAHASTKTAPPPSPGMVRMFHGGEMANTPGSRFFTPDLAYAEGYAAKSPGAGVSYIDIPESSPYLQKAFDDTGTNMKSPYIAFDAPEELASQRLPYTVTSTSKVQRAADAKPLEPFSRLGRELRRGFDSEVRGGVTKSEQAFGRTTYRGREVMEQANDATTLKMVDKLNRTYGPEWMESDEILGTLRAAAEAVGHGEPIETVEDMVGVMSTMRQRAVDAGKDVGELDDIIRHFARGLHGKKFGDHGLARQDYLTNLPGGTEQARGFFRDEELHRMIDSGAKRKAVAARAREKYASPITPDSPLFDEQFVDDVWRERLADWKRDTDFRKADLADTEEIRAFRRKHKNLVSKLRYSNKDYDSANIHPLFDEIVKDDLNTIPGYQDATLDEAIEILRGGVNPAKKVGPKPRRSDASILEEAAARAEEMRAQGTLPYDAPPGLFDEGDLIPNEYETVDEFGQPIVRDRIKAFVDRMYELTPAQRKAGLFRVNPVEDFHRYIHSLGRGIVIGEGAKETFTTPQFWEDAIWREGDKGEFVTFSKMLKNTDDPKQSMRLNPDTIARHVLEKQGTKFTKKDLRAIKNRRIKKDVADRFAEMSRFGKDPETEHLLLELHKWSQNLFKGSVTSPWPSFLVRNWYSSQVQNMMNGLLRPTKALSANKNARTLIDGGIIEDAHTIPAVKAMLKERNLPDEAATDVLRDILATVRVWEPSSAMGWGTDVLRSSNEGLDSLDPLTKLIGRRPGNAPLYQEGSGPFKEYFRRMAGRGNITTEAGEQVPLTWNPIKGQMRGGWTGAEHSTFAPFAAGEITGSYTEALARIPPVLDMMRQGIDPAEAAKRVKAAQVDYSARSYTEFERKWMKRAVPFYSFSKGMSEYVANELLNRPGGAMAQTIKQTSRASEGDGEMNIRLGELDDGSIRSLTGFGLMHEQPLSLIGTRGGALDFAETSARLMSNLTPLAKAGLEKTFGESLFMRGPLGGRELGSMDPALGGTVENIKNIFGKEERAYPAPPLFGSPGLEMLAANLPTARLATTARTLTDKRKYEGTIPGLAQAGQLLTGIRVTDESPMQRLRQAEREQMAAMQQGGAYSQLLVRHTKRDIERAEKEDPERAEQMRAENAELARIRKERSELLEGKSGTKKEPFRLRRRR